MYRTLQINTAQLQRKYYHYNETCLPFYTKKESSVEDVRYLWSFVSVSISQHLRKSLMFSSFLYEQWSITIFLPVSGQDPKSFFFHTQEDKLR